MDDKKVEKLTQDKIFDFMCQMGEAMRAENIPIVNYIVHDFHRVDQVLTEDEKKEEKEERKNEVDWELIED